MANLTLRGLLFKTEIDRQVFLVKVSVDSSLSARSISDLVKLTENPDTRTDGRTYGRKHPAKNTTPDVISASRNKRRQPSAAQRSSSWPRAVFIAPLGAIV